MLTSDRETRFKGLPLSEGVALGQVCLFNERRHNNVPIYKVAGEGSEREKARVEQAVKLASDRLDSLIEDVGSRIGQAQANIFVAQKLMVRDPGIIEKVNAQIDTAAVNAETAVTRVLDEYEARLLEVDDEYIRERATDIGEVKRRILDVLRNMNPALQCGDLAHCQRGGHRLVVAEELTPSMTVDLDTSNILGFVTERGGAGSHAAILARSLGIPAVSGITNIHSQISCGTEVLVDGSLGEVIIWPSEACVSRYPDIRRPAAHDVPVVEPVPGLTVMANISRAGDTAAALDHRAEGIGLYRTEFELFAATHALSEDEQFERYISVVRAMAPHPVTFRLWDIGGDKSMPFLDLPHEENPYLGFRGGRLLLARPDLFVPQARALARASAAGPVNVMYPMVIDLDQFRLLKKAFQEATADIDAGEVRHGVMFEVPSACLQAREILAEAEFGSIGTNDLIQYLFAVDRNNDLVAYDYVPDRPVLWSVIAGIVAAAEEYGRPLSLCGELASTPAYLRKLLDLGIRSVSVSARMISQVRLAAQHLAEQAPANGT